ncbi:MAG: hypothetical protein NTZ74_13690 [Chloroflexi bacterium]|nr:hypothetical protein [Chloroflexota bacterium]
MNNSPVRHKRKFVPDAVKFLVAVSSLAGTFGVWNFLANKDLIQVKADTNTVLEPTATLDLQPLPTLVPLISVDLSASAQLSGQAAVAAPTTELRSVAAPKVVPNIQLPAPGGNQSPVVIGGGQSSDPAAPSASSAPSSPPPAAATTQSSKP